MTQERGGQIGAETALPELKVAQVLRSPEPVLKINPNQPITPEMGTIQPVGEYTMVLGKDADEIQVFDKAGRRIEGLSNTQTMILDWKAQAKKDNHNDSYTHIAIDTTGFNYDFRRYCKKVDDFPQNLQKAVEAYLKERDHNGNLVEFPIEAWQLGTGNIGSIQVRTEDGYVLFHQTNTSSWIGFQTQDERGVDLPPRNWKRFDLVDEWAGRLPQNIVTEFGNLRIKDSTVTLRTENGYHVLALKDSLAVTKPGQKITEAEFTDQLVGIGNNVCQDPRNRGVLYYCTSDNPRLLVKLDTTKDPGSWVTETVDIPQEYESIRNLQLDLTGNFFMFQSNGGFVILAKDTLQEVQKIPKLFEGKLDEQGRIKGVDEKGNLVVYDANFKEVTQELEKRRVERLVQGLAADLFEKESATAAKVDVDQYKHLVPVKTDLETQFDIH